MVLSQKTLTRIILPPFKVWTPTDFIIVWRSLMSIDGLQYASLTAVFDALALEKCTCVRAAHDSQPMVALPACTIYQIWRPMTLIAIHLFTLRNHRFFSEQPHGDAANLTLSPCKVSSPTDSIIVWQSLMWIFSPCVFFSPAVTAGESCAISVHLRWFRSSNTTKQSRSVSVTFALTSYH